MVVIESFIDCHKLTTYFGIIIDCFSLSYYYNNIIRYSCIIIFDVCANRIIFFFCVYVLFCFMQMKFIIDNYMKHRENRPIYRYNEKKNENYVFFRRVPYWRQKRK